MKFRGLQKRLPLVGLIAVLAVALSGCSSQFPVLDPQGPVARTEAHLIELSTILVAIVVIPVLILMAFIVYKYRDKPGNTAKYSPNWAHSGTLEFIWWAIPILIIGILGAVTAKYTFSLTKPPVQNAAPLTIQVTSLDYKWLFQYPDQKIATVNYVDVPAGVPIQFELTADSPINSFWVPALGGQEYAMPGMDMRLWLQADKPGTYNGSGASFTGEGFAHMQFQVISKPQSEFNAWVNQVKSTAPALSMEGYNKLKQRGIASPQSFSSYPAGTFEKTVNDLGGKYMPDMEDRMKNKNIGNQVKTQDMPSDMPGMKTGK